MWLRENDMYNAAPLKTEILIFNLFLAQILQKKIVRESHNLLLVYIDHVLLGWHWKVFIFWLSITINCPRSRLKHPSTNADFQSKQITCSFICFPIMEQHCLTITSFVPLRILDSWVKALIDFVQMCEVFVLVLLCSYTAYEHVEAQSMSPLISLNWF